MNAIIALRAAGVGVLCECTPMPTVLYWGDDFGDITAEQARELAAAAQWPVLGNSPDVPIQVSIVPEARYGWAGTPGLVGSREGRDWAPTWELASVRIDGAEVAGFAAAGAGAVEFDLQAPANQLRMRLTLELLPTGLVRAQATLTNQAPDAYELSELTMSLPVPAQARQLTDFAGRWGVERAPQTSPFNVGAYRRENRHGRTGHDASFILTAGEPGASYRHGQTWAVHTAWSGNHIQMAQRDYHGAQIIGGGELLLPGEVRLTQGESYTSPWIYFNYADGLDAQARRFHQHLRGLDAHPSSPRPVTLNVWEAVYFDHRLHRLQDLADRAADLGVERYVLDDGWFGARRDDHAGLGDWVVSAEVWPDGLHPLIQHVKRRGMQFGLWFEPEMVNEDSDVARAHPEWIMQLADRLPERARHQQVLNLSIPEAFDHVLHQMSAIFTEYDIDYVKWDHNRDLIEAGTAPGGEPATSAQTHAYYRLISELRNRFPQIEFESCASGGGRIDLEVMNHVQRVWVSDNIDPHDRQSMLWWTGQMLPPEVMGSHVASGRSHMTGRWHDLDFRAATAMFGHFGIEWDLAQATEEELTQLRWWIEFYKAHRETLHTGELVRLPAADAHSYFKGIVTEQEAIYSLALLDNSSCGALGPIQFPGLAPEAIYRVEIVAPGLVQMAQPQWIREQQTPELTGAQLSRVGLQAPVLQPGTAALFVLSRIG